MKTEEKKPMTVAELAKRIERDAALIQEQYGPGSISFDVDHETGALSVYVKAEVLGDHRVEW